MSHAGAIPVAPVGPGSPDTWRAFSVLGRFALLDYLRDDLRIFANTGERVHQPNSLPNFFMICCTSSDLKPRLTGYAAIDTIHARLSIWTTNVPSRSLTT